MRKLVFTILLFALIAVAFSGCLMRTADEMYCLPKRSETYNSLQSAINSAMADLEYCAPIAGDNQQTVQMADLDGDGLQEYLLFAKANDDRPLRILIFANVDGAFVHTDTVTCNGTAFDRVEYAQIDKDGGVEIVVGRMLSDQVLRTVAVYSLSNGEAEQLVTTNYSYFLTSDLDADGISELFVLRPGLTETEAGQAELYTHTDGTLLRSNSVNMSSSVGSLKRIVVGKLHGGQSAVYVASSADDKTILTDVYILEEGLLTNVSVTGGEQTMHNYYVYADDIDSDGVIELPGILPMRAIHQADGVNPHNLIRWYALCVDGSEVDKMYTYHNFLGGWYLELDSALVSRISVTGKNNIYDFYLWDEQDSSRKLMTLSVLTGQSREEQSLLDGAVVLYKSDSVIYTAFLEEQAQEYGLTAENVIRSFHLIHEDWKTGET